MGSVFLTPGRVNHTGKKPLKEPRRGMKQNLLTGEAGKWPGSLISSFICNWKKKKKTEDAVKYKARVSTENANLQLILGMIHY